MSLFEKQKIYGTPITKEEALSIVLNKTGIITGGGYTYLPDMYCAQGSIPGCFRGGSISSLNESVKQWYRLNLKELVIKKSFFPDPFTLSTLTNLQANFNDYSINLPHMVKFCIDSEFTSEQLIHDGDFGNSKIWYDYFDTTALTWNNKEMNTNEQKVIRNKEIFTSIASGESLSAVGEKVGLSKARVSTIVQNTFLKIRGRMKNHIEDHPLKHVNTQINGEEGIFFIDVIRQNPQQWILGYEDFIVKHIK